MSYKPNYDTTVKIKTYTEKVNTKHTNYIDWEYDWDNPDHTNYRCESPEEKKKYVVRQKERIRKIEQALKEGKKVKSTTYGGWPRIYQTVIDIGMASCWPYWSPRPTVWVHSSLGIENQDWKNITNILIDGKEE